MGTHMRVLMEGNLHALCSCASARVASQEIISFDRRGAARRIVVMLRVIQIVQILLQKNKHASKRDVYYTDPSVFQDQATVDCAINDICVFLQCSRHNLNVVSPSKGLIMGWLQFFECGRQIDCTRYLNVAFSIPMHIEGVQYITSFAKYVLVVEKEAVFHRLLNDNFCKHHKCIVLTGKGYPDVSTRRFLQFLTQQLNLPAYALVDYDPYGFDILATYCFGSRSMAYDVKELSVPAIHWLGAFASDILTFKIPNRCLLPLTETDRRKIESLLKRCYLQKHVPKWRAQLYDMWEKGIKFEIEAISSFSFSLLPEEYIPLKINSGNYL